MNCIRKPKTVLLAAALAPALYAQEKPEKPSSKSEPVRLEIDARGVTVLIEGKSLRYETLAELAEELSGFKGEFVVARKSLERTEPLKKVVPSEKEEKRVDILEGKVQAVEFARFLSDHTGLPVIYDSRSGVLESTEIAVPTTIKGADYEMVKALLETNGILVTRRSLPDGRRVLELKASRTTGDEFPRARPIVVIGKEPSGATVITDGSRRTATPPRQGTASALYAGITLQAVPEMLLAQVDLGRGEGVLVAALDEKRASRRADLAALQLYDIVTHVGDTRIGSAADLVRGLNRKVPGERFTMRVLRKGLVRILRLRR